MDTIGNRIVNTKETKVKCKIIVKGHNSSLKSKTHYDGKSEGKVEVNMRESEIEYKTKRKVKKSTQGA